MYPKIHQVMFNTYIYGKTNGVHNKFSLFLCNADWLWLLSGFVHLVLSTFIGYRGGKRNKNSWIAFFGILQGILAVLLALINASDHYNFQRPSALILATSGKRTCTIMKTLRSRPFLPNTDVRIRSYRHAAL